MPWKNYWKGKALLFTFKNVTSNWKLSFLSIEAPSFKKNFEWIIVFELYIYSSTCTTITVKMINTLFLHQFHWIRNIFFPFIWAVSSSAMLQFTMNTILILKCPVRHQRYIFLVVISEKHSFLQDLQILKLGGQKFVIFKFLRIFLDFFFLFFFLRPKVWN
jgi:hypothetical protein